MFIAQLKQSHVRLDEVVFSRGLKIRTLFTNHIIYIIYTCTTFQLRGLPEIFQDGLQTKKCQIWEHVPNCSPPPQKMFQNLILWMSETSPPPFGKCSNFFLSSPLTFICLQNKYSRVSRYGDGPPSRGPPRPHVV